MESGTRRGEGITAILRRRERIRWLLSVIAASEQIELTWLLNGAGPSESDGTVWHYEKYVKELVRMDLVWVHRGRRGVRIVSATTRGRRALIRIRAIEKAQEAELRRRQELADRTFLAW